jgi:hypothetical protein
MLVILDPDPHWFGSMDPDPHWGKKLDPDPNADLQHWFYLWQSHLTNVVIRIVHPRSGSWFFNHNGSRNQESKRHRIPKPGSATWTNVFRTRAWATAGADSCGRVPPTPSTDGTSSGSSALDPSTRGNYEFHQGREIYHKINNMYKSKQMISLIIWLAYLLILLQIFVGS